MESLKEQLEEHYSAVFEDALIHEIADIGLYKEVKSGETLMEIGSYIKTMPLLLSGAVKILREDDDGDELLLYYLEKGETCSMTMTCCLGDQRSKIRAIAEIDTVLVMIPVRKMEEWSAKYKTWRHFVFESYNARLNELFETIDSIAFNKMDDRLIGYLKEKVRVTKTATIYNTHQEIAYDMHTSRVVISRLLKKLENLNKISLNRNAIEILDL